MVFVLVILMLKPFSNDQQVTFPAPSPRRGGLGRGAGSAHNSDSARGPHLHRRDLLGLVGAALPAAALLHLFGSEAKAEPDVTPNLSPRPGHHVGKAKSIIHLFMNGGPSQMDLFDPKPELDRRHGETYFDRIAGEIENLQDAGAIMRSPFKFAQHGQSGLWVSSALPNIARHADRLAVVRSMFTTNITHEPAISINGLENWQAGFLPPTFQGTRFRSTGAPVLNLQPSEAAPSGVERLAGELLAKLDRQHMSERPRQPRLGARIASYELAARMQVSASEALDLASESQATLEMYGIGREPTDSYGRRCLIARRLVERGVRFVQLYINAQIWDNHTGLATDMQAACDRTDLPIAGLLADLAQRGLLEETLVVWGGEFGRLPIAQLPADKDERKAGRDHNKNAFTCWLAGAGVKGGHVHGATDELGLAAVESRVSVPDWHATLLHLAGLSHEKLAVNQNGLQERLTGVHPARVVREILL
jgi:hypothetical protein